MLDAAFNTLLLSIKKNQLLNLTVTDGNDNPEGQE